MGTRLDLQNKLEEILGSRNVYFQPPENLRIKYPCIVYERNNLEDSFADNIPYVTRVRYGITVIDRNPDSDIPLKVKRLPTCVFERQFVSDNLYHNVFNLYF